MRDVIINLFAWVVAPAIALAMVVVAIMGFASVLGGISHLLAVVALLLCSWWFFHSGRGAGRLLFMFGCALSVCALACAAYIGGVL